MEANFHKKQIGNLAQKKNLWAEFMSTLGLCYINVLYYLTVLMLSQYLHICFPI